MAGLPGQRSNGTANDGTEQWTVTGPATAQARIRASNALDLSVFDLSNVNFTLGGGSVTVLAPNGGEVWGINSTKTIQWSTSGIVGTVKIELSRNGGATWTTLFGSVTNDGTQNWTVTSPATSQARIRVTSVNDPPTTDTSNANFIVQ